MLFVGAVQVAPPEMLVREARYMLSSAAVGMTVGVPENPYNSLALQLKLKEDELARREAALATPESKSDTFVSQPFAVLSMCVSLVLFVLLLLNFYFDWHRERMRSANAVQRT